MPERHKGVKSNMVFIATSSYEQHGYDHSRAPWPGTPSRPYGHLDTLHVVTAVPSSRPLTTGQIYQQGAFRCLAEVGRRYSAVTAYYRETSGVQLSRRSSTIGICEIIIAMRLVFATSR